MANASKLAFFKITYRSGQSAYMAFSGRAEDNIYHVYVDDDADEGYGLQDTGRLYSQAAGMRDMDAAKVVSQLDDTYDEDDPMCEIVQLEPLVGPPG